MTNHHRHPAVTDLLDKIEHARHWIAKRTVCRWSGHNTKRRKMRGYICSRCSTFTPY